jgi:hypothetical protein
MLNQQMNDLMNGHSKRELVQLARAKGFKGDSERIAINCEDGQTLTGKAAIAYWLVNGDEGRVMDEQRATAAKGRSIEASQTRESGRCQGCTDG